jgi:peptidoglycan/xylan/chitin deacetylase (PgdA/CDA1 family)
VVVVHPVRVAGLEGPLLMGGLRPLVGPADPPPYALSGIDVPAGDAWPEAVAVRLRREGVELRPGAPHELAPREFVAWSERRGRSSVEVWRQEPSLLTELQLGAFHHATVAGRAARRVLLRVPAIPSPTARALRALADAAFWRGARAAASDSEWTWLTRGYTVLLYHRLAGEMKPGQERLDLPPAQFAAQLRMLRRLGFHPLTPAEAHAFHRGAPLPRRAVLLTADDAFRDAAQVLTRHADRRPVLFVPTAAVGGAAHWADGEPIASWDELRALQAAGGELGAHSRTHADLPSLGDDALREEVAGSLEALGEAAFAYPHGRHDHRVREATRAAGATLAFTTATGRNGAGTDPWCLRRVGIKAHDGLPAVLWKVVTGQGLPGPWERRATARRSSPPDARAGHGPPAPAPPRSPRA